MFPHDGMAAQGDEFIAHEPAARGEVLARGADEYLGPRWHPRELVGRPLVCQQVFFTRGVAGRIMARVFYTI